VGGVSGLLFSICDGQPETKFSGAKTDAALTGKDC